MDPEGDDFVDILEARRRQNDAFGFMSRYWNPQKAFKMEKYVTPKEIKEIVAKSLYIESIIESECSRTGASPEELKQQVVTILEEMGLEKKMHVVRWLGIFFIKTVLAMKIGVLINEKRVFQLKAQLGSNPVLFLPTHRSYADFCLMTYLCFHYDIELPAVAAGVDFMSMAVMGSVMRATGAFYIRRSLDAGAGAGAGAGVYAAALRRYVRALVTAHPAPVEFFLEGTRSRSNKPMLPKYGLISMALLPFWAGEVGDVTIVPVSIGYDRLVEQALFAHELLGVPKPKETTGGLLKALNVLKDDYGKVYINMGEPFSAKEYFKQEHRISSEVSKPMELHQLTPEQFELVQNLAQDVISLQQKNTVITIFNLIAIILMHRLVLNKLISKKDLNAEIVWVSSLLKNLGATVLSEDIEKNVARILNVHRALVKVDKSGNLRLTSSAPMLMSQEVTKRMKGHKLKSETMVSAVGAIQLQLYVNPALHWLVPAALLVSQLYSRPTSRDDLWETYSKLRTLLKYEFFYVQKDEAEMFRRALDFCQKNEVITHKDGRCQLGSNGKLTSLLSCCVWPALTTLSVTADVMASCGNCLHGEAVKAIQRELELRKGCHPYCLSLELVGNCLQGLASCGALIRDRIDAKTSKYRTVSSKLEEVTNLVKSVLPDIYADFDVGNPVIMDQRTFLSRL